MDVFALRDQLVGDYGRYAESFLAIRDERVHDYVRGELDRGALWPDPPLDLNPAFDSGGPIDLSDSASSHGGAQRLPSHVEGHRPAGLGSVPADPEHDPAGEYPQ